MKRRFEGKTLDDAISHAAEEFGVETYQLTYHIAVQKRGFLGGTKRVVIEAEPAIQNEEGADTKPDRDPAPKPKSSPKLTRPRPSEREEPVRGSGRTKSRKPRRGDSRHEDSRDETPNTVIEPAPDQGPRSPEQEIVAEWCGKAIELAHLDLEIRTDENDEEILVRLFGKDSPRVMARGGEILDSLQVLVNKAFVGRKVEKRIEFDVGTFKKDREAELGEKAKSFAEEVKREGTERLLPAMTPIERRIVHIALRDVEGVETVSRGNGFLKRVAIIPRDED